MLRTPSKADQKDRGVNSPIPTISEQILEQKQKEKTKVMEEKLKVLVHQRGAVKGKLTRIRNALEDNDDVPNNNLKNVHFLQQHSKTVELCYGEYNELQNSIYALALSDERRSEQEQRFIEFESLYNDLSIRLAMLLGDARQPAPTVPALMPPQYPTAPTPTAPHVVPQLKAPLPTFDGTYESWFSFKCMFQTIMARYENESPAIKLYHLRNSLVGKAAGIIDQDIINNNDYAAAWAILTERFEDKRLIEDKHIEALFTLPKVPKENSSDLRRLLDTCVKNVEALKKLGLPVSGLGERMVVNLVASKMDNDTRKAWEAEQKSGVPLDYAGTIEFLKKQCRILEKMEANSKPVDIAKPVRPAVKSKTLMMTSEQKCTMCDNKHELYKCELFKKNSVNEKYNHLRKFGLCFNCMQKGHRTTDCSSSNSCRKCSKRHHTLLHPEDRKPDEPQVKAPPSSREETAVRPTDEHRARSEQPSIGTPEADRSEQNLALCTTVVTPKKQTLLSTAVILVYGRSGVPFPCRTLIDSCSQNNFITERFANLLALRKHSSDYLVSSLNGGSTKIRHVLRTTIKSRLSDYSAKLEFLIAPRITADLPSKSFDTSHWNLPAESILADPTFNKKGRVDMLLGAETFWDLMKSGRIKLAENLPSLTATELGYVVGGVLSERDPVIARTFCNVMEEENLNVTLRRFWEIEGADNFRTSSATKSNDCIEHFQRTHTRDSEGRFIVRLPFNERKGELGESLEMATRRFLSLERRLDQHPDLKQEYSAFIAEYESLGHMKQVEANLNEAPGTTYYLPHHCVLRPGSTTTKLRVVFDGSAPTTTGVSINDALQVGPTVQADLESILLNFRSFRYVFTVDVPKMFRQIRVHNDDAPYQRILYRTTRSSPLKVFQLQTVTYGLASSPFLATMSLCQLAEDGREKFPSGAAVIKRSCYIDDALSGGHTKDEAIALCKEFEELLHTGGFEAHKWCANAKEILEHIPAHLRGTDFNVNDGKTPVVKTLGIAWNPEEDWFTMQVEPITNDRQRLTRKQILSDIAKIFDPLGFVGPVITAAKLIFREVGLLNLNWDDEVPKDLAKRWHTFREELCVLNDLKIRRWIDGEDANHIELHGFGDSSDDAYGACLYTRLVHTNGSVTMRLICSKSRLLPKKLGKTKAITTPRAELLAAVLLSRMVAKVMDAVDLRFTSVTLWSDSTIVLSWIQKAPAVLQQFVSNRVREIQQLTNQYNWRYISTDDNPADLISRGERPKNLIQRGIWWYGPAALQISNVSVDQPPLVPESELPEIRPSTCLAAVISTERLPIFERIGNFAKLQRCMVYVVRFAHYIISRKKKLIKGRPTAQETADALKLIIRLVQREAFQNEISALQEGSDAKHRLRNLNPFIDPEDDVLRVGGRIKRAFIPFDSRHQMLLPAKHPVTEALVRYQHEENLHAGQKALLAVIRQRYWPLNVKSTIRKVIKACVTCFRVNPTKTTQLMGDLPSYRVQPAPVFAHTGIDFAGPFHIKSHTGLRKAIITKGYLCLFVCMSTRALHIEVVSDLTTEGFLAALKRFVGRRGLVSKIYSDNATNFVGSQTELEKLATLFSEEQHTKRVDEFCRTKGIEWSFIPPRSPHFGGIWEAGVKSVKFHLKRIVGSRSLTFEELTTTVVQIEAQLNSRPLTQCSDDPNDLTAISPAHFLIGREMQCIPEPSYLNLRESALSRWQLVQAMQQQFWKRWTSEYLPELQNRQKWFKVTQIRIGALVLIVDPNAPPMQWQLARIIALHPGRDNVIRVVTLKTPKGECKRAVTEICLLPLDKDLVEG